jgi:A/G-specific adenine glycosylase
MPNRMPRQKPIANKDVPAIASNDVPRMPSRGKRRRPNDETRNEKRSDARTEPRSIAALEDLDHRHSRASRGTTDGVAYSKAFEAAPSHIEGEELRAKPGTHADDARQRSFAALASTHELPLFRKNLLAWYRRVKRDLEWRRTRDPYRIWLSEIMLQQTRVAAVIPYYRKFLSRFPSVQHLARARIDSVLRRWAGLGYYSRARNLHRAARQIVELHGGSFPRQHAQALALPGIGSYTAAAVLSIAYDEPLAVLDGNVARVLARLSAIRGDLRLPSRWRELSATANGLLQRDSAGDWNQAMMELGATVCTPQSPRCTACPVEPWCRARALGIEATLPSPRVKASTVRMTLAAAVFVDPAGRTLLIRNAAESGSKLRSTDADDDHARSEHGFAEHGRPKHVRGQQNRDDANGVLFSRLWQFPAVIVHAPADDRNAGAAPPPSPTDRADRGDRVGRGDPTHRAAVAEGTTAAPTQIGAAHAAARARRRAQTGSTPNSATHSAALARHLKRTLGVADVPLIATAVAKHAVTYRDIRLAPYLVRVECLPQVAGARTLLLCELDSLPVSSATRKIAAAVLRAI